MTNKDYKEIFEISKIFNRAVKKAQDARREKGLPNVYSVNGKVLFELPDGRMTTEYQF